MKKSRKKKFDAQEFFTEHGEKIAFFSILALAVGWGSLSAIQRETYEHEPDELVRQVDSKRSAIMSNKPDVVAPDFEFPDYPQAVQATTVAVQKNDFPVDFGPTGESKQHQKRTQPPLLKPREMFALAVSMSVPEINTAAQGVAASSGAGTGAGGRPAGGAPTARPAGGGAAGARLPDVDLSRPPTVGAGVPDAGEMGPAIGRARIRAGVTAPAGSKAAGRNAVLVTARVPQKEQTEIFRKAFEQCLKPEPSRPVYYTYLVERADVTENPANPKFEAAVLVEGEEQPQPLVYANLLYSQNWAIEGHEVAPEYARRPLVLDPETLYKGFTFPIPPKLNEDWGEEARGSFEDQTSAGAEETTPGTQPKLPGGGLPGIPAGGVTGAPAGGNSAAGGPPAGIPVRTEVGRIAQQQTGRALPGAARTGPGAVTPAASTAPAPAAPTAGGRRSTGGYLTGDPHGDFLLRFFDFTVQQGRRYTYRVRIILENPNFELPERYLESPALAIEKYILTDWSDPTEAVEITGMSEVLLGDATPPRSTLPAAAKLIIRQRYADTGAVVSHEFSGVERGQLLNFSLAGTWNPAAKRGNPNVVLTEDPLTQHPRPLERFEFVTNEMVLDVRGGARINRGIEPAEMLVVDDSGWVSVKTVAGAAAGVSYASEKTRLEEMMRILTDRPEDKVEIPVPGAEPMAPRRNR